MTDETQDSPQERGGKMRAESMTKEARSALATVAAAARWGHPKATHEGILGIGEIPCYVLKDGRRLLSRKGLLAALGMREGSNPKKGGDRLANFAAGKGINPFVSADLAAMIREPIPFTTTRGTAAFGFKAEALVGLCESILAARRAGALQPQQQHIAAQAEILVSGLARVGIVALVDEATGYQADRAKDALAKILEAFVVEEMRKWVKTFPTDYYKEMFRLRGWAFPPKDINAKPPLVGTLTNNLVYARLAPGVLDELKRVTPRDEAGRHKHKLHQHLTDDVGVQKLREHLTGLIYLMKANTKWSSFLNQLDLAMPKRNGNFALDLGDA